MTVNHARALSIAGSDSGGGAGVQADLKTFAALGVYGMTAITAITAQNTVEVTAIQDVNPEIVRAQIRAVVEDIGVDAAKTGMLHTRAIIAVVAEEVTAHNFPLVVDPVMVAKSGAQLLEPEAKNVLIDRLLPVATVVTPNALEAAAITGILVETLEDAERAARRIVALGTRSVVVKGGHLLEEADQAIDVLLHDGTCTHLAAVRHATTDTHGTGCSFSAAIAAELAKGVEVPTAVHMAKQFVNHAIQFGLRIGRGPGPLNPMAGLYNDAARFRVLENVRAAVRVLEACPSVAALVAEVGMNVGMALPYAADPADVAAVEGRLAKMRDGVRAAGCPEYDASGHVARTILAVRAFDPAVSAGVNLRYAEATVRICEELGLVVSHYDRREEPTALKAQEGMTTRWGAAEAVKRAGRTPDVIYHRGDWGKEPMVTLVGATAVAVAERATEIARRLAALRP
jgi:hydroxymethylpyrimidine/phosphomethylpyrimidine kinase